MKIRKSLLAAVGAILLLGTLTSSVSARWFSISNEDIEASFREVIFRGPFGEMRCQAILESNFHARTMAKVITSLIGYITNAELGPCSGGTATILEETLPWHVRYSGFQGALPNITSIVTHVIDLSWRLRETFGGTCLVRSTAAQPVRLRFHRSTVTHDIEAEASGRITTGGECGGFTVTMSTDLAPVSLSGVEAAVWVSLI